jgi:K+-sensing histidine kinase KdpD
VVLRIEAGDEERWLTCSYAPLSDGGYVAVARDETARKELQDDKDGWIAQVSHELRTPLTPIKGFLHTLARRDAELTTDDRARIYEIMLREERRLEALVDSLLRSTQLDAGGMVVNRTEVDWAGRVEEQVELVRRQDPSRTITVDVEPGAGPVLADEGLAMGVLTNLLSNAVKYAGGEDGSVEVVVEADGGELVTSVIDHGPGIPRSDRTRIFDKFTRLGNHLTRSQQGVGLGLHIAKQSVERLDGRIWVDETPGGGATFRFTLPRAERARRRSPLRAPGSPRSRS